MKISKCAIFTILGFLGFFLTTIPAEAKESEYIETSLFMEYAEEIGEMYNIDPFLLRAMAEEESSMNINAQNKSNPDCKGLMQVSEKWHKDRMEKLGVDDLYDPYSNILVAADYISELLEENNNVYYVLMRYNMRINTADKLYKEGKISDYAKKIVERSEELATLSRKVDEINQKWYEKQMNLQSEAAEENKEKADEASNLVLPAGGISIWMM